MQGGRRMLAGGKELNAKLLRIERKVAKQVVKKAVRAATKPMIKAGRSNARSMIGGTMGGLIAKNIKAIVFKFQRSGSWGMQVGMKPDVPELEDFTSDGKKNYIPAAIEYGHDDAAAIPFIRKSWDATKALAKSILGIELKKGVESAAKG